VNFCLADDLATLVWAANLADLELHTSMALASHIEAPTMVVFDLDPGAPATIVECAQVALWLRQLFDQLGLRSFAKTSGSKGMQLYVPLNTPSSYEHTKPFARTLAELLEGEHPELVVSQMAKILRPGRVLVDWSQNDEHKTTVCVYSLRALAHPTASTPLTWPEVEALIEHGDPARAVFGPEALLDRVEEHGDLFAPVLELEQELPALQP